MEYTKLLKVSEHVYVEQDEEGDIKLSFGDDHNWVCTGQFKEFLELIKHPNFVSVLEQTMAAPVYSEAQKEIKELKERLAELEKRVQ